MKKFLQFLGGAVVAASVIPYAWNKDEESGEQNVQALLWKASFRSQPQDGEKKVNITLGFNNPFQSEDAVDFEAESDLFEDDDLVMHYQPVCECTCDAECAELNDCCCQQAEEAAAETVEEAVEEVTAE